MDDESETEGLFLPQPVTLLLVHHSALIVPQVRPGATKTMQQTRPGVLAQRRSQSGIGVCWCLSDRYSGVGGAAPTILQADRFDMLNLEFAAISFCVLPAAVSSSARHSLRTMSSAKFRFRPAMFPVVLSAQFTDNKTLKQGGPGHRGHANFTHPALAWRSELGLADDWEKKTLRGSVHSHPRSYSFLGHVTRQ
ncbi:hypothetical protein ACH49C_14960 [Rhodococcus sp. NPDC019609]|uniref:hypothetical protein n=1 Tax=unclassified Rhodococcus (in: high G+C Gram-positive bacteria) TaxID=192944 RepID=UPI0037AC780B